MAVPLWYFGAHRMGKRVGAAITVFDLQKMISYNFVGRSSGKIVNLFSVDAERIGDFCCYIHGVWLLPIQVFPAFAAMFATILAMVSNTPLAKGKRDFIQDHGSQGFENISNFGHSKKHGNLEIALMGLMQEHLMLEREGST
ncbi:hypothetical protein V6N11_067605 [Hibiscus sabdariffa]|uniref:Uncharacterized protein n=1 Tax=Hibiscus sabdariffa TaxID=183260 RepID=A0ABR2SRL3_9ROSI